MSSATAHGYDGGVSSAKIDPTATTTVRRRYGERLRGRWDALKGAIRDGVADRDVFGLRAEEQALSSGEFRAALAGYDDFTPYDEPDTIREILARRDAAKVNQFMDWLNEQIEDGVLEVIHRDENPYIRSAYDAGTQTVLSEFTSREGEISRDIKKDLGTSFGVEEQSLQRLFTRNYDELEDITSKTADAIRDELTSGFVDGLNPNDLARNLNGRIDAIGKNRSTVLARTEIINAYSDGTLDRFESMGGQRVIIRAEWLAADDARTCPVCASLDGKVYTTTEVRHGTFEYEAVDDEPASLTGTYPIKPPTHPQCRCALSPVTTDVSRIPT